MLDASPRQDKATLVNSLVAQFERDLADGRFAPGAFIGTRQDLCAAYRVTSPIFFQASRVLINRGLAELRPGARGGLFASGHGIDQVGKRMTTYLECIGVDFHDARPVTLMLQECCLRDAVGRLSIEAAAAVRATTAEVRTCDAFDRGRLISRVFLQFADASGDIAMALLFRAINGVMLDYASDFYPTGEHEPLLGEFLDLLGEMAEAVIAADHAQAAYRYQRFREVLLLRQVTPAAQKTGAADLPNFADRGRRLRNLPERLATHMLREIRLAGWPVGQRLGAEPDLLARYGVSRATFRQALRLLEEYSAVETRRGPRGGVLIASPNAAQVSQTALALLLRRGADLDATRSLLVAHMTLALDHAFTRGEPGRAAIVQACRANGEGPEVVGAVASTIFHEAHLKPLEPFVRLLAALEPMVEAQAAALGARQSVVVEALAGAVRRDDRPAARGALAELIRRFGVGNLASFH